MAKLTSWVNVSGDSDFSIYNIPFGIFSNKSTTPRIGAAIGDQILDLAAVARLGHFNDFGVDKNVFKRPVLNDFMALGKPVTKKVRKRIQQLLSDKKSALKEKPRVFTPQRKSKMHMPVEVGDYTDFYSSIEHATNVGKMFRDPENALLPNWRHIPVGYHGRASSIVIDGTPVTRPRGQVLPNGADGPGFQPTMRLDFELEMGFIIGKTVNSASRLPPKRPKTIFLDWCCSTTGRPGTYKNGNTFRWVLLWAKILHPLFHRG